MLVGCTPPAASARRLAPLDGASTVAALERLASGVAPGTRVAGVASDARGLKAEFVATDGTRIAVRVAAGDVQCPGCVGAGEGTVVPEGTNPLGASLASALAAAIRAGAVAVRWVEEDPGPRAGLPERLRVFVAERPVLPLTGVDTTSWPDLLLAVLVSGLWLAFAWTFLVESARALRATPRGDLVLLGLATGLAAMLGVLLAGFGPGAFRLNFPGAQYGTATAGLARWVWSIAGISPESLVWKNLVLGALVPAVMAFLVRSASRDRVLAWTAGGLAAVQPLFVVFSGEAGPPTQVVFLAVVALWALLRVLDTGRLAPVVLHASAVWLCTESRPEAVFVVPMAWGLAWAVGKGRRRLLGIVALEAFVAAVSALPWIGRVLAGAGGSQLGFAAASFGRPKYLWRPEHAVWLNPEYTAIAVVVLILCGLVVVLVRRRRLDLWVFLSMVLVAVPTCGLRTADQCLEWVRYVVLLVVFATWLAALGAVEAVRLVAVLAGRR
ncbi:MAG TPA: hypothetical protein PK313_12045, partial [Myxococcota bacterium]|nr:hypothetical protein [Myxococcota bacterium]